MEMTMRLAIETYSGLSGIDVETVTRECLAEGPVRRSVMMLVFATT